MDLTGSKALVVGLGKSGLAAIELLVEKGARVQGTDSRPVDQIAGAVAVLERLGVAFSAQSVDLFRGFDLIVLSPGVPVDLPEVEAGRKSGAKVIGEVELASWYLRGPVIGITGSNGKTTTTALTGHLLKECGIACQVGGNIGLAPAGMTGSSREDQWNVLELSSFQLETVERFRAAIGVCVNVTPDHLDRHHTFAAYAAAKRRLFETQGAGDWAVLNADDPTVRGYAAGISSTPVWFSVEGREAEWRLKGDRIERGGEGLMPAREIPLRGRHNIENVMAAAAAAHLAGAGMEGIRAAVRSFPGVEHRLEFVREADGVAYYNDSKATNVDATLKAIAAFGGGLWIILGGKDKGSDYRPLAGPLKEKARAALLIGAAAEKIASEIGDAAPVERCGTLENAVRYAAGRARLGDTVLLAPACASFDQFENYEHRGRMFKTFVAKIVGINRGER